MLCVPVRLSILTKAQGMVISKSLLPLPFAYAHYKESTFPVEAFRNKSSPDLQYYEGGMPGLAIAEFMNSFLNTFAAPQDDSACCHCVSS